ncbi:hypothetical protein EJ06DRAFT_240110 [Trichodelitschia bisporula]|uniref:Centromere protein X n=1 Tax=Trichodelitschia bisporula TaxID=703511 RepID=A0A6G1HKA6_9PEZI|nr:hypothetical protein EJ06DRAFT_240110 [Trichodelitschia bisporula]
MPPKGASHAPFKPPRPVAKPAAASTSRTKATSARTSGGVTKSTAKGKGKARAAPASDDENASSTEGSEIEEQEEVRPARRGIVDDDEPPPIPEKLLARLLRDGFEDEGTKIGAEAMSVVGKYVETFVREAIARAMEERRAAEREAGDMGPDAGFLQVEDLEKLAPQLVLDF